MKQSGYILPFCLLFIALLSLLSLTLLNYDHWQQRLTAMHIAHQQNEISVYAAVSQFFTEKKDFTQDTCTLDWHQADTVWQKLISGEYGCMTQQGKVKLRYIVLSHAAQEPIPVAIIARMDSHSAWQPFQHCA